jgi:exodeoxyribonuclease VII large subunit
MLDAAAARVSDVARRRGRNVDRELVAHERSVATAAARVLRLGTHRLGAMDARLRALDPRRVLERGYTITRTVDGVVVRTTDALSPGDVLTTETARGSIRSRTESVVGPSSGADHEEDS